jgi:hypothetical protein
MILTAVSPLILKKGSKMSKSFNLKLKKLGIHVAVFAMMGLAVYLSKGLLTPLQSEVMRLFAAMACGAYACKPIADLACRKLLNQK